MRNAPEVKASQEQIRMAMENCGLSSSVRGEALTLEEFAALSDALIELM